jgi:hypothetical protein
MPRLRKLRVILVFAGLLGALMPASLVAQDSISDPNDVPLGDVARTMRKKAPSAQGMIDDDNLKNVMQEAESRHAQGSGLKYLMAGDSKGFHVSAPDVTCSLAFTANVKSLLSNQYAQMDLSPSDVLKLEGPATIEGDTLIVSVYNRTEWHLSEIAVAMTVVKKSEARGPSLSASGTSYGDSSLTAVASPSSQEDEVRPEKKPDETMIYQMRAGAPPQSFAVFSSRLLRELAPNEEWHWAIVRARGYPPRSYASNSAPTTAQSKAPALGESSSIPLATASQTSPVPAQSQSSPDAADSQKP